jgi:hypothetical protein
MMWSSSPGSPRGGLLPQTSTKRGILARLKRWKPLEGWSLGMVQTYFILLVLVLALMFGAAHCRWHRQNTQIACDAARCEVTKTYGGAVEHQQTITRSALVDVDAVRMDHGVIKDPSGMSRRKKQKLGYGLVARFRDQGTQPRFPGRGCVSWRQTAGCDPLGEPEPTFDEVCGQQPRPLSGVSFLSRPFPLLSPPPSPIARSQPAALCGPQAERPLLWRR